MTKLEELKKMIGDQFEKAEATTKTKDYIESFARMNNLIDEAKEENDKLLAANAELTKSYRELVMHPSNSAEPSKENIEVTAPDFDTALNKFLSGRNNN